MCKEAGLVPFQHCAHVFAEIGVVLAEAQLLPYSASHYVMALVPDIVADLITAKPDCVKT